MSPAETTTHHTAHSVDETSNSTVKWDFASHKSCPFCGKRFGRGDGARRHARTCPEKGASYIVPVGKRGRPQHACDECIRNKILCDAKSPCKRCASRSLLCTFRGSSAGPAGLVGQEVRRDRSTRLSDRPHTRSRVPFLLACTDPRSNFVNDVMAAGEPESEAATSATWTSPAQVDVALDTIDPRILFLGYMDPDLEMIEGFDLPAVHHDLSDYSFSSKVERLRTDLRHLAATKHSLGFQLYQERFDDFFTTANFHELMMAFFRRRQLLARMIHWATFEPVRSESGLLLAIALCGEAYTAPALDEVGHRPFISVLQYLADKFIFNRLKHCSAEGEPRVNLELCQAAYLITILQISDNDAEVRRKAITKRQSALMDTLRRLQIIQRQQYPPKAQADWRAFAYEESCGRLAEFVCFNDGLLALFCNRPPLSTLTEMVRTLPCHEDLWDAVDEDDFASKQLHTNTSASTVRMKSVLESLLDDGPWDESAVAMDQRLTVFDLYAAIGAFQIILLNYRASLTLPSVAPILLRGLDRWEHLWSKASAKVAPDRQSWLGVARHAPEFALVSRKIIESSTHGAEIGSKYLKCIPQYDLQAFHQFLLQLG